MKIYLSVVIATTILSVFCFSCQKNSKMDLLTPQPDSLYLVAQLTLLDTLYSSGDDTSSNSLFFYDSNRRIQKIMSFSDGIGASRQTPYKSVSEYTLFYKGTDSLPEMIRLKGWNGIDYPNGTSYSDSLYIFYNNSIVVKDSLVRFRFEPKRRVRQFTSLSATRCLLVEKDVHFIGLVSDTISSRIINVKWADNNFVEFADTIFRTSGYTAANYIQNFDNKSNPFRRISIPYPIDITAYLRDYSTTFTVTSLLCLPSVNNKTSNQNMGSSQVHTTVAYEYNEMGFPVIGRNHFASQTPQTSRYKSIYRYSKM